MDAKDDEQTQLLRDLWKQLVATDRALSGRLDQTNATLAAFMEQTQRNFAIVQRNFERVDKRFEQVDQRFEQVDRRFAQVDKRFEQLEGRFDRFEERERARDVEARLTRLEALVGVRNA